ncbi:hypothetical protein [Vibrio sp. S9_S30]|nr:hypothetical protein [Vibrio sp. S9_S30]
MSRLNPLLENWQEKERVDVDGEYLTLAVTGSFGFVMRARCH